MSSREHGQAYASVGVNSPYHNILELVWDKDAIEQLADALDISHRNIRKDECSQWTISGKRGHLQTWGDNYSYLLYVTAYSARKWGAVKRKANAFGWQLKHEDGNDEGCFRLGLPAFGGGADITN